MSSDLCMMMGRVLRVTQSSCDFRPPGLPTASQWAGPGIAHCTRVDAGTSSRPEVGAGMDPAHARTH